MNSLARYTTFTIPESLSVLFCVFIYIYIYIYIYINSTNIPPIMIINRVSEHQNLLSL